MSAALAFEVPQALEAEAPPEERGLARDEVKLLVAARSEGRIVHARFRDLPDFLDAGDLIVVNRSATLPAAVPAYRFPDRQRLELRFSTPAPSPHTASPAASWADYRRTARACSTTSRPAASR